jgi:hypothetical protein
MNVVRNIRFEEVVVGTVSLDKSVRIAVDIYWYF